MRSLQGEEGTFFFFSFFFGGRVAEEMLAMQQLLTFVMYKPLKNTSN
jgi:hypothetical protein